MTADRVVNSVNNEYADRCVDFILRADGTYASKEFRRDPEDQGAWFMTSFDKDGVYARYVDAFDVALSTVVWLSDASARMPPFVP